VPPVMVDFNLGAGVGMTSAFPSSIVVSLCIRSYSSRLKSTASTSMSTILSCFSAKSLKFGVGDGYTERMQDIHVYRVTKQINVGGRIYTFIGL
jgi:hypothetical protein